MQSAEKRSRADVAKMSEVVEVFDDYKKRSLEELKAALVLYGQTLPSAQALKPTYVIWYEKYVVPLKGRPLAEVLGEGKKAGSSAPSTPKKAASPKKAAPLVATPQKAAPVSPKKAEPVRHKLEEVDDADKEDYEDEEEVEERVARRVQSPRKSKPTTVVPKSGRAATETLPASAARRVVPQVVSASESEYDQPVEEEKPAVRRGKRPTREIRVVKETPKKTSRSDAARVLPAPAPAPAAARKPRTPEERRAYAVSSESDGNVTADQYEPRHPRRRAAAGSGISGLVMPIFVVVALGIAASWIVRSVPTPFCDSGAPNAIAGHSVVDCIPCPEHGTCKDGKLECDENYLAVGKTCQLKGDVTKLQKTMLEEAERLLAIRLGEKECQIFNDAHDNEGGLNKTFIKSILTEKFLKGHEKEFKSALAGLFADNLASLAANGDEYYLSRNPYKGSACVLREILERREVQVVLFVTTACIIAFLAVRQFLVEREEAQKVAEQVIEFLEKSNEAAIPHLRDRFVKKSHARHRIWKKAETIIESDSRVERLKNTSGEMYRWHDTTSASEKQESLYPPLSPSLLK
eukprot:Opistho-2@68173